MPHTIYLQPERFKNSKHHTAYIGNGAAREDGKTEVTAVEFVNGVAKNVSDETFKHLKDLGIADTTKPKYKREED